MPALQMPSIPSGECVFLDANVFVYAMLNQSVECLRLLRRCATEEVHGVTTLHVINEATHRLMLVEAVKKEIIPKQNVRLLGERSEAVRKLSLYWTQVRRILEMNLLILSLDEAWLHKAHDVRTACGLLTNDSLVVAAMRHCGLNNLASADKGFDHVMGLARYAPSDLPRV